MKRCFCEYLIALWIAVAVLPPAAAWAGDAPQDVNNWLCYYGDVFGQEIYNRFDLVVVDSHHHPPLSEAENHPPILGYLSVGEVDSKGPYWEKARNAPYLVKENTAWDSWIVDIRDPAWQRLLLEVAIPEIFAKGFDGLFLDTFDSSLHLLETSDGKKYKGVVNALLTVVKSIKSAYPDKWIAVNRGIPILPIIAPWIDFIVYEDLYSAYDHETKTYQKVSEASRAAFMPYIERGLTANPSLGLLSIDYAAADQPELAREAIRFARKKGFIPYVSTVELDQIFLYTLNR